MKLINITTRSVHTKYTGFLAPGKTVEGNRDSKKLETVLEEVVQTCGTKVAIRLSDKEVKLINAIMNLDERGEKFDPSSIPEEIRNDPTGEKRAADKARAAQQKAIEGDQKKNVESMRREAIINGEIDERKPKGLATMEGKPVDVSSMKSGFDKILEENAKIAAGKGKANPQEMLDPVGAHQKGAPGAAPAPHDSEPTDDANQESPVKQARNKEDDGTKSADATEPIPTVSERAGQMDRMAAEVARRVSTIGPTPPLPDDKPAKPTKPAKAETAEKAEKPEKPAKPARGRGRKAE